MIDGTVAFIQANIFGGHIGFQAYILWINQKRFPREICKNSINRAILKIDEEIQTLNYDPFDCLNLGRYRSTDEWMNIALKIDYTSI